jgi:hypothetical protein
VADLIYTQNPAAITKFLRHAQSAGVPEKLTVRYLISVGFKSKNDRNIIRVMKSLGFIDSNGTPMPAWSAYRDKSRSKEVLGAAVRRAYSDLYTTYPDAHRKDTEAIRNFFGARTKVAESTLKLAVATFKALVAEATFDGDAGPVDAAVPAPEGRIEIPRLPPDDGRTPAGAPSININIELHLPETGDADVYEKLFAAMRKHLFDKR